MPLRFVKRPYAKIDAGLTKSRGNRLKWEAKREEKEKGRVEDARAKAAKFGKEAKAKRRAERQAAAAAEGGGRGGGAAADGGRQEAQEARRGGCCRWFRGPAADAVENGGGAAKGKKKKKAAAEPAAAAAAAAVPGHGPEAKAAAKAARLAKHGVSGARLALFEKMAKQADDKAKRDKIKKKQQPPTVQQPAPQLSQSQQQQLEKRKKKEAVSCCMSTCGVKTSNTLVGACDGAPEVCVARFLPPSALTMPTEAEAIAAGKAMEAADDPMFFDPTTMRGISWDDICEDMKARNWRTWRMPLRRTKRTQGRILAAVMPRTSSMACSSSLRKRPLAKRLEAKRGKRPADAAGDEGEDAKKQRPGTAQGEADKEQSYSATYHDMEQPWVKLPLKAWVTARRERRRG